jgi:uncharacterized protein
MSLKSCLGKSTARLPSFFFLLLIFVFGVEIAHAERVKDLKPQGYVNDFAGVLSAPVREKLTALCAEVDRKAGAQIAIVTLSSLGGEPIEQFSIDLATQWGVGPKQQARGLLILLAPNDRKYRVEVGYGLEGILPDGKVGGFGREMVPLLQRNDYGGAVTLLAERLAAMIAVDRGVTLDALVGTPAPSPESDGHALFPASSLVWLLILVIFLFSPVLGFILRLLFGGWIGPRRSGGWMGGPRYGGGAWGGGSSWGGGGFGGGGGGFGGFGGGSFGGGGASGGW